MAKAFNPAGWIDGVTVAKVADFQNIATDLYALGAPLDGGGHSLANAGSVTLIPGALPGTAYTVTAASWSGGFVTFTIGGNAVGVLQLVTIAGASPAGYNISFGAVTAAPGTTITVALAANPGTWVSGGTVTVGAAPGNGTVAVNSSNQVQIYSTATSSWGAATTAVAAGVWHSGAGVPSSGLGNNGDMYLNTSNGNVYGPKTAGAWGSSVENIEGPAGATGATGAAGTNGSNGATGATGPAGSAGYSPEFIVAAGAPSSGTGNNGDMYINSTTDDVYGPKSGGAWGSIACNIKGLTGATGAGLSFQGAYNSGTTYTQGQSVTYSSALYASLVNGNVGNTPSSSPTDWQSLAASGLADPGSNGIVKRTSLNVTAAAVANTDYMAALGGSGLVSIASGVPAIPSLTAHGVVVGAGAAVPNATAAGTSGQVLTSNGASADPTFQAAPMAAVAGTGLVEVTSGAPSVASLTAHGVVVGAGAAAPNVTAVGTSGQVLTSNGSGADPTFQAATGGGVSVQAVANPWIGVGTGSRALGTVYQNTSSTKALFVTVSLGGGGGTAFNSSAFSDSSSSPTTSVAQLLCFSTSNTVAMTFVVLPNNYYKVALSSGSVNIECWAEWQ